MEMVQEGRSLLNILILNAGSGSQKCSLFQLDDRLPAEPVEPVWKTVIESTFPGQVADELRLTIKCCGSKHTEEILPARSSRPERIEQLVCRLWNQEHKILAGPQSIHLIGHRVVHGGTEFNQAVRVDQHVLDTIKRLEKFAPLHNRWNLEGIEVMQKLVGPRVPQVAVFDTAFHHNLPEATAVYPGPYEWLDQGIRRYGFHGTSFRWAAHRAAQLLQRENDPEFRLILCHLGGGCSLAATIDGQSVDTTMGFTPLDGLAMVSRSGAVDPGILFYLLRENPDIDHLEKVLNKESGLKGLSGLSGDTRVLIPEVDKGNARAKLALDVFIHRLQAGIGQMLASLGKAPDALVFTDAISEDEPIVRSRACEQFKFLGLEIDHHKNNQSQFDSDLATGASKIRILLIKGREDWEIARQSLAWHQDNLPVDAT